MITCKKEIELNQRDDFEQQEAEHETRCDRIDLYCSLGLARRKDRQDDPYIYHLIQKNT